MGKKKKVFIVLGIIILIGALIYFILFYEKKCYDDSCYYSYQKSCSRASYLKEDSDASWLYRINGKSGESCKVNVKLLQVKQGSVELGKLQGENMNCYIPLGFISSPSSDLALCHGLLKEGMQEIIIQKMHRYIISNLGKIDETLKSAV